MRSYNNLYEPMLQDDYIKQRFINASKKKKNRNDVREVLENLDEHTELLKKMLTEELFIPDYHKPSIINESSSKKTLEKGDRNTAGTSGGNRQDIVSVNGLSA